jgi:hypothetical protein
MANDSMGRAPRYPFTRGNPRAEPDMRQREQAPRPSAAPRPASADPLSELARLIGQTDPFGELSRNPPPDRNAGWPAPPQPGYSAGLPPLMPEYRQDVPPPPPYDPYAQQQPGYYPPQPDPYAAQQAQHGHDQYDQQRYAQPPYAAEQGQYGHPADAAYYGDHGRQMPPNQYGYPQQQYAEPYDDERRPRRRSGLITIVAVLGLALVGTAGAYAYRTMFNGGISGPPPLIKADTTPNKIVPAPGSADSAAGKQIYDRVGSNTQDEKIVSREEQPVDVKANARPAYPAAGQLPAVGQWPASPGAAPPSGNVNNPAANQTEPHKVRTVTIRPDSQGNVSPPAATSAAPAPRAAAPAPSAARAPANAPLSLTPQATERVATASSSAGSTASAPTGVGYMVQVSAQKSAAEATSAFKSAQTRYSNLLGSYQVVLRKKEVRGKGTFYGAQVGPFETRDQASGLCDQLKTAGGNCLVEKN